MDVPQKVKNQITIGFSNPTSGCISEGYEITMLKRYLHSHVHCIIQNSHERETMEVSLRDEQIKKM